MINLLKRLMYTQGVSGREGDISKVIEKEISPFVSEIWSDKIGNLIAHKKGNGKRILIYTNMDECGFFVNHIDENGLIRVCSTRGLNYDAAIYSDVVSENGVCGILIPETPGEKPTYENVFIDIGAKSKKEAQRRVSVMDSFTCVPRIKKLGATKYAGRPLNNRIGCLALIEAIKAIKDNENDLYFVFTTHAQAENYGSKTAVYSIDPDIIISVSIAKRECSDIKLGMGAGIKIKDTRAACSVSVIEMLRSLAEENKIKYQYEADEASGYDLSLVRSVAHGAEIGAISIPCENSQTTAEVVDIDDVKNVIKLIEVLK